MTDIEAAAALAAVEHTADVVAVWHRDPSRGLVLVAANPGFASSSGWVVDEVLGRTLADIQPEDVAAEVLEQFERVAATRAAVTWESTRDMPAGRRSFETAFVPLADADGEVRHAVMVTRDVTIAHELQAALDETQHLAGIGHWSWDLARDAVVWSSEMHHIYGIPREQFAGDFGSAMALVHEDDVAAVEGAVREGMTTGEQFEVRYRIRRGEDDERTLMGRTRVTLAPDGSATRFSGTVQDITDAERAAERSRSLEAARNRLEQAMELNDDVIQGLAVALLALDVGDHDELRRALHGTMARVREIIRDLLGRGRDEPLEPGDLVRQRPADQVLSPP